MTVILLRDGNSVNIDGECQPAREVWLENGDKIKAEEVCWRKDGSLVVITDTKVYEISFSADHTLVVEHDRA
ncbi:hypothetical protein YN1HA_15510 [Sulfurisphaera ohwakuensis]